MLQSGDNPNFGHYVNFVKVAQTEGVDSSGKKTVTYSASYKFTTSSPIGSWTVYSKKQDQTYAWTTDSLNVLVKLVKVGSVVPSPVAPSGATSVTGSTGSTGPTLPSGPTGPTATTGVTGPTAPTSSPPPVVVYPEGEWLGTAGSKIVKSDGTIWMGRGANLMDTRGCAACASVTGPERVTEVKRRMDELVKWGANFIRLTLESELNAPYANYRPITQDAQYLADIKAITDYAATKPGLYIEVSLWIDSSFSTTPRVGWPTAQTIETWKILTTTLKDNPRVMFGLVNEPQNNFDGSFDAQAWTAMNNCVQAIRDTEAAIGSKQHIVVVQGLGGWSRILKYYLTHPIAAGQGKNVAYEVHVYDAVSEFKVMFEDPSLIIPVIIGEFGPATGYMTLAETQTLMDRAEALKVPYLAWAFHQRCPPNLLVDNVGYGCGINMTLTPSPWGTQLKNQLAKPLQ